jgi:hypothetical protein
MQDDHATCHTATLAVEEQTPDSLYNQSHQVRGTDDEVLKKYYEPGYPNSGMCIGVPRRDMVASHDVKE